jgi:hypothetical protein
MAKAAQRKRGEGGSLFIFFLSVLAKQRQEK